MNPNDLIATATTWEILSLSTMVHVACFGWVFQHIMRNRRDPVSAMLWILVTWSVPLFGFLLYVTFGINRVAAKTWKKEYSNRRLESERSAREAAALPLNYWRSIRASVAQHPSDPVAQKIDRALASQLTDSPLLGGNRITLLITGDEAFPAMLDAISSATHHIHIQSFIIGNDDVGKKIMTALREKARSGVSVRVLYDRFGSTKAVLAGFFRGYAREKNMQLAGWTMANLLKRQFQINLRNHRKLLIVDGRIAFTGGINLHDENVTRNSTPPIRDYHVSLTGPVASELQYAFLRDWYYITDENPDILLSAEHFPPLKKEGEAPIRVVNGGPATELDEIYDSLFACLVSAEKEILVVTPYFVPTSDIIRALRNAAMRGVDVRLVVPEKNNHIYAGWAGRAFYEELLESGVRIFERRPPFMHAKGMIIDEAVAVIGSANLDVRSLKLNYETNLMIYDRDFINRLKATMLEDISVSSELDLTLWRQRPLSQRMRENACSILTPIL